MSKKRGLEGRVACNFYHEWREFFESIDDAEEVRTLILSIIDYSQHGSIKKPIEDKMARLAFSYISKQIDRDVEKYADTCYKRSVNARRRWNKEHDKDEYDGILETAPIVSPRNANIYNRMQLDASDTDKDIVQDYEEDEAEDEAEEYDKDYEEYKNAVVENGRLIYELESQEQLPFS